MLLRLRLKKPCLPHCFIGGISDPIQLNTFNSFKYRIYETDYATHKQGHTESLIKLYLGFKIKSASNILHQNLNLYSLNLETKN